MQPTVINGGRTRYSVHHIVVRGGPGVPFMIIILIMGTGGPKIPTCGIPGLLQVLLLLLAFESNVSDFLRLVRSQKLISELEILVDMLGVVLR